MLENKILGPKAEHAEEITLADLANTQANTGLVGQNTLKQKILNQFLGEREPAEIGEIKARSKSYGRGGGRGGVGSKDESLFQNSVAQLNPELDERQQVEAANAYAEGKDRLSDGTPLAPITPLVQRNLDRAYKSTTTANLINQGVRANQAEAEIGVLQDYAQKAMAPYGDTVFNMSPEQIKDSFKTDPESQKRLGKLIAAQALQYEIAQNRIRLANGQPGVTSTQELMQLSGQQLHTKFPRLSAEARQEASRYLDEALKEGNRVRQNVGTSPSALGRRIEKGLESTKGKEFSYDDIDAMAKKYNKSHDEIMADIARWRAENG